MKELVELNNQAYQYEIEKAFKHLSKKILKLYKRHGETQESIDLIKQEALKSCESNISLQTLLENISDLTKRVKQNNTYYVLRIIHTPTLKVALHLAPYDTELPMHTHLNALSAFILRKGGVQLTQMSSQRFNGNKQSVHLSETACSAGLQHYKNSHSLKTTKPLNIFFSLRCKVPTPIKLKLACSIGLLLSSPLYACGDDLAVDNANRGWTYTELHADMLYERIVKLANKIRSESSDDDDYLRAFELYQKVAKKNNAEALYWLAVMYLKGMGVTDDDDKALLSLSASVKQNYPPAKKLMHYLMTTDEALDC